MATWDDYTLLEEKSNNDGAWLESVQVKKDGLVLLIAGNHDVNGTFPQIEWEGVTAQLLANEASAPYEAGSYEVQERHYRYRYSGGRYWYYTTRAVQYHETNARLVMLMPKEDGTLRFRAQGNGIYYLGGRIFQANVTPTSGYNLKGISFAKSIQLPRVSGSQAIFNPQAAEIIVAIGTDGSPNSALADVVYTGPAYQELWSKLLTLEGFGVRIKVWRIKSAGKAILTFQNCSAGRMAEKFIPYVKEGTTQVPSPSEPRCYFEMECEENAVGHVERPRWFQNIYHTLRNGRNIGLRKSWTRENLNFELDPFGRLADVRYRRVEQWAIPTSNIGQIDPDDAMIFANRAEADDRIVAMDNYW